MLLAFKIIMTKACILINNTYFADILRKNIMRCRLIVWVLTIVMVLVGCVSNDKFIDPQLFQSSLLEVERAINQDYTRYKNSRQKKVKSQRFDFDTPSFTVDNCILHILNEYQLGHAETENWIPILFDLNLISVDQTTISIETKLFFGTGESDVLYRSGCEPFEEDYYIGWEVYPEGPQEPREYNSKCDGTQIGMSGFQMVSDYMANEIEFCIPNQEFDFAFDRIDCFDLRFENNTFSNIDYRKIVENCIGRPLDDFRPEVCVPFYDLNCLYCELFPLIEKEVKDKVLLDDQMIAIFYFYFGYNSIQLDDNSMGYGLCYGYPEIIGGDDDTDSPSRKKVFRKGQ